MAPPWDRPHYEPSKLRLTWSNGAKAELLSADEPERFRGKTCDTFIADELASWRYPEAWHMLKFGASAGASYGMQPRGVVATTPKPTALIKQLLSDPMTHATRGSTFDNRANLASVYVEEIRRLYEGTRLGRQELYAAVLDDAPGALWTRDNLDATRIKLEDLPELRTIVVSIDPAVTSGEFSNESGIIVSATAVDGHGYVLADLSGKYTPDGWGRRIVKEYVKRKANRIVAEVNQGGDLVTSNIATVARDMGVTVHVTTVHAARGKRTRAEPVSALYEQGRVHHVGVFAELEDQLCEWEPDVVIEDGPQKRVQKNDSPDRLDALVWGLTDLMVDRNPTPARSRSQARSLCTFEDRPLGYE